MNETLATRYVISSLIVFWAILLLCNGCVPLPVKTMHYTKGRILLLPPRDVVQNGMPHPFGVSSGHRFQHYLVNSFATTSVQLLTTESKEFNSTKIAEKTVAIEEAERLGADYCLQVVLGEFQDFSPPKFQPPDYVLLDRAVMYNVRTGETVWELVNYPRVKANSAGTHFTILRQHAAIIARSIHDNMK